MTENANRRNSQFELPVFEIPEFVIPERNPEFEIDDLLDDITPGAVDAIERLLTHPLIFSYLENRVSNRVTVTRFAGLPAHLQLEIWNLFSINRDTIAEYRASLSRDNWDELSNEERVAIVTELEGIITPGTFFVPSITDPTIVLSPETLLGTRRPILGDQRDGLNVDFSIPHLEQTILNELFHLFTEFRQPNFVPSDLDGIIDLGNLNELRSNYFEAFFSHILFNQGDFSPSHFVGTQVVDSEGGIFTALRPQLRRFLEEFGYDLENTVDFDPNIHTPTAIMNVVPSLGEPVNVTGGGFLEGDRIASFFTDLGLNAESAQFLQTQIGSRLESGDFVGAIDYFLGSSEVN